ncbi:MAG TPA: GNAT family N-acetyltransferase [Thermoplasmata archaeon]|jgi:ribosomal protein S18 acetylase RimI-like enzyme|nr:GNAT family N-acetyltransferase [Thermoplasmata archaeon]
MPGLELVPLESAEADEYWKAYVAGRADLPTPNFVAHMERYLRLPPEEQQTYFAFKENGRVVGTVRIGSSSLTEAPNALGFFSLVPEARSWARDAILLAAEPLIANGAPEIQASYDESYSEPFTKVGFQERFSRIRMELSPLAKHEKAELPLAHPEATDVDDIATFLREAYEGHMEQAFGMHVGSAGQWADYVTSIWKGESGTYLPLGSWITRDAAGALAGASLASLFMGTPLISELAVRPDARGKGLGRSLMIATTNALVDLGYERLALYVTIGNDPAIRLYEDLGFRRVGARSVSATLEL